MSIGTTSCDLIATQPADRTVTSGSQAGLTVAAPGAISYQWYNVTSGVAVLLGGQTGTTLTTTVTSQSLFFVRVSNGICTIDSRTATVSIGTPCTTPDATISAASPVNAGGSSTGSVPTTSGATYAWTITNGTITSGASGSTVVYTAGCSGNVVLHVTVTASCGTSSTNSATIGTTAPTATVGGGGTIANGASVTLTATMTGAAPWSITWSDGTTQSNQTTSPISYTVHPATTTVYTITAVTGAGCTGTSAGSATVTVVPATPTGLQATLLPNGTQISLTWVSSGASSYTVQRMFNNGGWNLSYGSVNAPSVSFVDTDPQIATRGVVTYVYRVVGVSGGTSSSPSAPDIATAIQFTNDPLSSGSDINGTLIADARLAVDAVRASAGLTRSWTDYSAPTGLILSTIFYESSPTSPPRDLFNALNQGRTALGLLPMAYPSDISPPAVNGDIRWQHLDTIRVGVK